MCPEEVKIGGWKACPVRNGRGLAFLGEKQIQGNLVLFSFLGREGGKGGAEIFLLVSSNRTYVNVSKTHQGRLRLDSRKQFFTERVAKSLEQAS